MELKWLTLDNALNKDNIYWIFYALSDTNIPHHTSRQIFHQEYQKTWLEILKTLTYLSIWITCEFDELFICSYLYGLMLLMVNSCSCIIIISSEFNGSWTLKHRPLSLGNLSMTILSHLCMNILIWYFFFFYLIKVKYIDQKNGDIKSCFFLAFKCGGKELSSSISIMVFSFFINFLRWGPSTSILKMFQCGIRGTYLCTK